MQFERKRFANLRLLVAIAVGLGLATLATLWVIFTRGAHVSGGLG